jgi:hypothetical protein
MMKFLTCKTRNLLAVDQALRTAAISLFTTVIFGCATQTVQVSPPSAEEVQSVRQGKKVAVLLRLKVQAESKPVSKEELSISIASIDKNEQPPASTLMRAPTEESDASGWLYFFAEPGTYFFHAIPKLKIFHMRSGRYGYFSDPERILSTEYYVPRRESADSRLAQTVVVGPRGPEFKELPGYWFRVPENESVIYIGSLETECSLIHGAISSIVYGCPGYRVGDETSIAETVARTMFPGLSKMTTQLMVPLGGVSRSATGTSLLPMTVTARQKLGLTKTQFTGAKGAGTTVVPGVGQAVGIFNIVSILGQEASFMAEDAAAEEEAKKWAPCFRTLQQTIDGQSIDQILLASLRSAFGETDSVGSIRLKARDSDLEVKSTAPTASMFEIENITANLRECVSAGTFCVEVLMRVRIRELKSGDILYDTILAYTNDYPPGRVTKHRERLYHVRTDDAAPCRAMTAYCGNGSAD